MALRTWNPKLAVAVAVTLFAAAALAAIVLLSGSSSGPRLPTSAPDGRTGDKAVDSLIDHLLRDDAEQLRGLAEDVSARAGAPIGGPVGLGNVRTIGTHEWTARLATADRSLHAVFRAAGTDRTVPQEQPPFADAGPVVDPGYDFYVVLAVTEADIPQTGWRFGVTNGRIVNLVIATGPPGAYPPGAAYPTSPTALEPSPLDEYDRFLVPPPETDWPAPTPVPRSAASRPPGTSPAFAPDGRTGDPALDEVIEALLTEDVAGLERLGPDLAAREERFVEVSSPPGASSARITRVSVSDWTNRLASSPRSLYAVVNGDPVDVILAVDAGPPAAEAWTFAVRDGKLVEVNIHGGYVFPGSPIYEWLARSTPSPAQDYDRFLVLPPEDQLPQPPLGHDLSVRTGDEGVDRLLAMLQAHDWDRIWASVAGQTLAVQAMCGADVNMRQAAEVEGMLRSIVNEVSGIFAVANAPEGSPVQAEHVLVLWSEERPYFWTQTFLLEREGEIVGVLGCIPPEPPAFIVPPPAGGIAGLSASRRSGIAVVDAVLDAIQSGNEAALEGLIDYSMMACPGENGPPCLPGEAPGTLVEVLPGAVCHGEYPRREEAASYLLNAVSYLQDQSFVGMSLYAVVPRDDAASQALGPGPGLHSRGTLSVLLAGSDGSTALLGFSERGVTNWSKKCGPPDPEPAIPPGPTSFLLRPP